MQYFHWRGLFIFLLLTQFGFIEAIDRNNEVNDYRVTRSDYTFSTVFDMASDKELLGSVVKSMFHMTTHYDSYDRFGLYMGSGICRLSWVKIFYNWATEIDLYDESGQYEGMIDVQVDSLESAKLIFYDVFGQRVAIGYLDKNCMGFSLVDPDDSAFVLARLTRNFVLDTIDNWNVTVYHPERFPPQMVRIFAAFVCDSQDKFKPDL